MKPLLYVAVFFLAVTWLVHWMDKQKALGKTQRQKDIDALTTKGATIFPGDPNYPKSWTWAGG